jgi:hypothetical protein
MTMKNLSFLFILLLSSITTVFAQEQDWSVGMRVGEPAGLTVRKYVKDKAFELNVGTFGGLWGTESNHGDSPYKNVGLAVNGHLLFFPEFKSQKIKLFYGFGGQINSRRSYPDRLASIAQYEKTISLGGSVTAGAEYFMPSSPLSIYLDAGLYTELLPVFLYMHVQGGVGVRFNF